MRVPVVHHPAYVTPLPAAHRFPMPKFARLLACLRETRPAAAGAGVRARAGAARLARARPRQPLTSRRAGAAARRGRHPPAGPAAVAGAGAAQPLRGGGHDPGRPPGARARARLQHRGRQPSRLRRLRGRFLRVQRRGGGGPAALRGGPDRPGAGDRPRRAPGRRHGRDPRRRPARVHPLGPLPRQLPGPQAAERPRRGARCRASATRTISQPWTACCRRCSTGSGPTSCSTMPASTRMPTTGWADWR